MTLRIAVSADDYMDCYTLIYSSGFKHNTEEYPLQYPTVMLEDEDGLVGFISTDIQDDLIIAGPLVMRRDKSRPFSAMKLMSFYENVMRGMGIKSFVFWIDTAESGLTRGIKKYVPELVPYAVEGTREFYVRRLDSEPRLRVG